MNNSLMVRYLVVNINRNGLGIFAITTTYVRGWKYLFKVGYLRSQERSLPVLNLNQAHCYER